VCRPDHLLEQRSTRAGHLHHGLVGLDLGQDVAYGDRVALTFFHSTQASLSIVARRLHDDLVAMAQSRYSTSARGDDPGWIDLRGLLEVLV